MWRQQEQPLLPRALHPDFQAFPRQAVLCRLAGVEPRPGTAAAAAAFLGELAAQGELEARLLPLQEGELPVQVQGIAHRSGIMLQSSSVTWPSFPQLYLRRGGEVVEVAERLVEGGLVTRERAVARAVATGEVVARAYYRPG